MHLFARRLALALLLSCGLGAAHADGTAQSLPFNQDWSTTTLITANDNWSGVPGIEGFLGQDATASTGLDPQTITGTSAVANDLDVIANQSNTTNTAGGVAEFDGIANPVAALQGSGTADAPNLIINLSTLGQSGINVAYNLRDLDGSADNAVQAVALQYRVGNTGAFINVPAGFVADATSGPSLATQVTAVSTALPAAADNQALVQVRIITSNAAGSDEWVGVDDIAITAGGGGQPTLSIADTSAAEGDSGTTTFFFPVTLSSPAGPDGFNFSYATADGTATAGSDYVGQASTARIGPGGTTVTVRIDVNGDTDAEDSETFFVNLSNFTGALAGDVQGQGTINNDDFTIVPIHTIQGAGAMSPLVGQTVTTLGIVTGRKSNGFFLQTSDADADSNPATSQGVFVFTGSAPPANAAVGNRVQVTGTVLEYVPTADPGQLPLTELGGTISVNLLTTGNALPTPVALSNSFPDPAGALDQLEPLEGMRVTAPSFTVVAPTGGSTNEPNATATTNGIFSVVVTGTARPFREPGIQQPDAPPAGSTIPPIPQWDFNPELLTVVSRGIGGAPMDVAAGTTIGNLVGPLDYGFRRYTIVPDPAVSPVLSDPPAPTAARVPTGDEFTVASYNVERFFDTVNDPAIGEPVLTAAAFESRLDKASLAIRNFLHAPDILGVVEIENLTTLQALATRINTDAVAAGQPDPAYAAYLEEGNDVGGIDVGFLVKSSQVRVAVPRIEVIAVTQLGKAETWIEPAGDSSLLNDRPPLQLDAQVHFADGRRFPLSAIVVHQRSLGGAEADTPSGERIRAKRQRQAEYLASRVQALQLADPGRHLVLVGDFNAFEFNDGFVDAMNVVTGTPTPDNQTVVAGDGVDLVDPDLLNLYVLKPAAQRYSFVFGGSAQSLDHVLVNQALGVAVADIDLDHARINADFPQVARNVAGSPVRLSDHDPSVAYFAVGSADLSVVAASTAGSALVGDSTGFTAVVANAGPTAARFPGVGFAFDAELADLVVTPPTGWSCDTPTVAGGSTVVACSTSTLASAASANFTLSATAPASAAGGDLGMVALVTSQTTDPVPANDQDEAAVAVRAVADLAVELGGPALLDRNSDTATIVATTRFGGGQVDNVVIALSTNAPRAVVTLSSPTGWNCAVAQTPSFSAQCTGSGSAPTFAMTLAGVGRLRLPFIEARASIGSAGFDPTPANDADLLRIRVVGVTGL